MGQTHLSAHVAELTATAIVGNFDKLGDRRVEICFDATAAAGIASQPEAGQLGCSELAAGTAASTYGST